MGRGFKVLNEDDIKYINSIIPKVGAQFMNGGTGKVHDEGLEGIENPPQETSIGSTDSSCADDGDLDYMQKVHDLICPKTRKYVLNHLRGINIEMPQITIPQPPQVNLPFSFQHEPEEVIQNQRNQMTEKLEKLKGKLEELKGKQDKVNHMVDHCPGKWDEYVDGCDQALEYPCARVHNKLIRACGKSHEGGEQVAAQCDKVAEEVIKWASQYKSSLGIWANEAKEQFEETIKTVLNNQIIEDAKAKAEKLAKDAQETLEQSEKEAKILMNYAKNQAINLIKEKIGI